MKAARTEKQVDLNCSTLVLMQSPQILLQPSWLRKSLTGWIWVMSSCALLLETSQPPVLPTGVQEAQQLGFWFSVTKAVVLGVFSTSECFICALNAFLRQRKIKKLRSRPEDADILTQHSFTFLRTYTEEEQENLWTSSFSRSRSLKISLC